MGTFEKEILKGKHPGLEIDPTNEWIDRVSVFEFGQPGDRILFHGDGGYKNERSAARELLSVGQLYTLKEIVDHGMSSDVHLEEVPGAFNSVMFEMPQAAKRISKIRFTFDRC